MHSRFGILRTRSGEDLVRLEEVHALLCESGKSPHDATREIFSPFYMECLDAAESVREPVLLQSLYFANALVAPDRFVFGREFSKQERARFFTSAFPALGHVRLQDETLGGLLYSMAEGALRVWHGKADIATDRLAMVEARRAVKTDEQYGIRWPDDADLRSLLGRLAVPFDLAHSLWAWGRVAEVVPLKVVSNGQPEQAPLIQKKTPARELLPEWTGTRLRARHNELKNAADKAGQRQKPTVLLANECGLTEREITRRMKSAGGPMGFMGAQLTKASAKSR